MSKKIIPFHVPAHRSTVSPSTTSTTHTAEPIDEAEIQLSCAVIAQDFSEGKSVAEIAAEWQLELCVIEEVIRVTRPGAVCTQL